MEDNTA